MAFSLHSLAPLRWSLLLFLCVFLMWQISYFLFDANLVPKWLQSSIYLEVQIISFGVTVLIIMHKGSSFRDYGFSLPHGFFRFLYVSILFALIYILLTLFLVGSYMSFKALPPITFSQFMWGITSAIFLSIASESVFRGYIQTTLTKTYGFSTAVFISSVMYSIYSLPLLQLPRFTSTYILTSIVSLLMGGIFLGFFFNKAETLLCPIVFRMAVLILRNSTTLEVATTGYVTLYVTLFFELIAYSLLILIVWYWKILEKKLPKRKR